MNENIKRQIIEALEDQKEIFGDELFETSKRKTEVLKTRSLKLEVVKSKKYDDNGIALFEDEKEEWEKANNLDELYSLTKDCKKCPLHKSRKNFVFGSGNPNADIMCIGEGPGAEEDKQGLPFVGRAGQLLTEILKAIKFTRDEVYIANILKSRPPENRTPLPEEMDACLPYLVKQIELIKPKLILCLGLTAAQALLKKKASLTSLRGQLYEFMSAKVMVTYHPAALLRNPNLKRDCWEDVKKFRILYDEMNKI